MRIKLDENVPERLIAALERLGHDVDSVRSEGLRGKPDRSVWEAAQADNRVLLTQDLDFADARVFRPGTHHGIILVRVAAPGRNAVLRRVVSAFQSEQTASWTGQFVVISDRKVRSSGG